MRIRLALFLCCLYPLLLCAQTVTPDPAFQAGTGFNDYVYATTLQPDGKLLAGGNFTSYRGTTAARLVRINANGTHDNTFAPGILNNAVRAIAVQPDGKILIGGVFTEVNGVPRSRIARLNANGTVDQTFNPGTGFNSVVRVITLLPDGSVLAGGDFTSFNGVSRQYLARLSANGTFLSAFNPGAGFNSSVHALAVQQDGKIVAGGRFSTYNGITSNRIIRLLPDGTYDSTFVTNTGVNSGQISGIVNAVVIQPDGRIVAGGNFDTYHNAPRSRILRLHSGGSLDLSFNPGSGFSGSGNEVTALALTSAGRILAGGSFTAYNGSPRQALVSILPDGSADSSFTTGSGFNNYVFTVSLTSNARIVTGGAFTTYNGASRNYISRLSYCPGGTSATLSPTACGSYTLNGQTYTASGTYTQTLTTTSGCDSTLTIQLTLHQPAVSQLTLTACGPYALNGQTYTASGTYTQTLSTVNGCDSVLTLLLTIQTVDTALVRNGIVLTAAATGATYQWLDCSSPQSPALPGQTSQTFVPQTSGHYAVAVTQNGCTDTSACYSVLLLGTAADAEKEVLRIFPNPARQQVIISPRQSSDCGSVRLRNASGQMVCELRAGRTSPIALDVSRYAPGLYLLEVEQAGVVQRVKLVIE